MPTPRLLTVTASTRPSRGGVAIASWFHARAQEHGGFELSTVDLAEENLPMLDEAEHPRFGNYRNAHTLAWQAKVAAADAFVFVMPEYNWSFTAPLKNALDYLSAEWAYKAVGFVSYGGVSAGTRAVTAIRPVVNALRMWPATAAVNVPLYQQFLQDSAFVPNETVTGSVKPMLDELRQVTVALAPLRGATLD